MIICQGAVLLFVIKRRNDICIEQGIHLDRKLYAPYFFKESSNKLNQNASVLITQQQILITTNPKLCNVITAINELQCRQDEIGQYFEPTTIALLGMVLHTESQIKTKSKSQKE